MIVTVYNFKGGVGKTSISLNLSLTLGWGVITNDFYSPIEEVLDVNHYLKIEPHEEIVVYDGSESIIYDFGGQIDTRVVPVVVNSDLIIIPVLGNTIDLQVSMGTIEAIEGMNRNIIIVANQTEGGDFDRITQYIRTRFQYPIFELKKSKVFSTLYTEKKSIRDLVNEGGLRRFSYASVGRQFQAIIDHILSVSSKRS